MKKRVDIDDDYIRGQLEIAKNANEPTGDRAKAYINLARYYQGRRVGRTQIEDVLGQAALLFEKYISEIEKGIEKGEIHPIYKLKEGMLAESYKGLSEAYTALGEKKRATKALRDAGRAYFFTGVTMANKEGHHPAISTLKARNCEVSAKFYEDAGTRQDFEKAKSAWLEAADAYEKAGKFRQARKAERRANEKFVVKKTRKLGRNAQDLAIKALDRLDGLFRKNENYSKELTYSLN